MEQNPIIDMFGNCYDSPLMSLMPLTNIPVEMEDESVHTAENGYCCGDPTCYCGEEVQG